MLSGAVQIASIFVSVTESDGKVMLKTEQARLDEVFYDTEFELFMGNYNPRDTAQQEPDRPWDDPFGAGYQDDAPAWSNATRMERPSKHVFYPKEIRLQDEDGNWYVASHKGTRIDAGHGGYDGGAVANGVTEKDVNLSIAYWLKDELTRRGYSIYMTRTDDDFVGLTTRANRANAQDNPVCLISVHQNSIDESSSVHGVEAWTYKREGCTELGDAVCDGVSKRTGAQNRGTNYRTNLVVTSKTTMPAVIVECGYLTNPEEAEMLSEDDYQIKIAKGIADGIDTFSK